MNLVDTLGITAGFVSTLAFLPQVIKICRTQSTKGISLGMYILYSLGLILWGIYAYLIQSWLLLLTEIVTSLMTFYILVMKVKALEEENLL
jgi:MtN3 and saliva related transmembrane protein